MSHSIHTHFLPNAYYHTRQVKCTKLIHYIIYQSNLTSKFRPSNIIGPDSYWPIKPLEGDFYFIVYSQQTAPDFSYANGVKLVQTAKP